MIPHRARGVARPVVVLVLTVLLCGLAAGCSGGESDGSSSRSSPTPKPVEGDPSASAPRPSAGRAGYYRQQLVWTTCRDDNKCARLWVPLDHAKPKGRAISISVLKVPAGGPDRMGSMVINPGGPGVSGLDYAARADEAFGSVVRRAYDIVGFDPRGVGRSTPVECVSDQQLNALVAGDPDPDTAAEQRASDRLLRRLGEACLEKDGELARHVSTVEVAKDMDILRAALGDARLTYVGSSYGTAIGATYADLFPKRVRRMVLDGALDPALSTVELNLGTARGFETALRAYVAACVGKEECFLGSTVDEGVRRIDSFLQSVQDRPLTSSSGRSVSGGEAFYGVSAPLYHESLWPVLDKALQDAFGGDGSLLLTVADSYLRRNAEGEYQDNGFQALFAINCLDRDDAMPSSQVRRYLPRFEKASPTFGAASAYSIAACDVWPIHSGRVPKPVHATGSAPIMVVGTTRDPATPLVWARALARQLDNAALVTRDGDGHLGYRRGNSCVDDTVERYLVSGSIPPRDVTCA